MPQTLEEIARERFAAEIDELARRIDLELMGGWVLPSPPPAEVIRLELEVPVRLIPSRAGRRVT